MATLTNTYGVTYADNLLKRYYEPALQEQIENKSILLKRLQKNSRDIQGMKAYIGMHSSVNPSPAARATGALLPYHGKQGYLQATVELKKLYGSFFVAGPDVAAADSDKASFARLIDDNVKRLGTDMAKEANRQLNADGSGFLAFTSGSSDQTTPVSVVPYLWNPATRYCRTDEKQMVTLDIATMAAHDPTEASTANAGLITDGPNCTDSAFAWDAGTYSSQVDGDIICNFGASQYVSSSTVVRREMMGLYGIVHDTDLPGDENWKYNRYVGLTSTAGTGSWKNSEGANYDISLSSTTNNLQDVDAETYTWWRSKVIGNDGTPTALTTENMDYLYGYLTTEKDAKLSLILSTWKVLNKYQQILKEDRRFVDSMKLDGGVTAISYNGIPMVADPDCARGTMYFLDESVLSLYQKRPFEFIKSGGDILHWITGYDAFQAVMAGYCELGVHNRGKLGKIIDINEE
jgi:hypothetical protein